MNTIDIYRPDFVTPANPASLFTTIKPDDNNTQFKKIMGENELRLTFQANHYINFFINDFCTVFGEKYKINKLPVVTKKSHYLWDYTLVMNSEGYDLSRVQFLFLGSDNLLSEPDFALVGNVNTFVDLVISNLLRAGQTGWVKGQVIATEYHNMTFKGENCFNVLGRIAEEFLTEFAIEGKTIHITKRSKDTGFVFKQGQQMGLYELVRKNTDNENLFTRIWAYGSDKNLPPTYRDVGDRSTRLRLAGGERYIQQYTNFYGIIETVVIFDDIFPHRTGIVTAVDASNPFTFTDVSIDFNVNNQLLPGVAAKVTFNTGQLAGYVFEIRFYDPVNKIVTLAKNKDETVLDIPSATLRPAIGDKYVFTDIIMPQSYINAAEQQLTDRATQLLARVSNPQISFQLIIDPVYMRDRLKTLQIGDEVWVKDDDLEIQRKIRVVQTTRKIIGDGYEFDVEVSDVVTPGTLNNIINNQLTTNRNINAIDQQLQGTSRVNTLFLIDPPVTNTTSGFSQLYMEDATGKVFKKV